MEILTDEGKETEPEAKIGWTCAAEPPQTPCFHALPSETYILDSDDTEPAELEFSEQMLPYLVLPKSNKQHQSLALKVGIEVETD